MGRGIKQGIWVVLILALTVWCVGCSDDDDPGSTTSSNQPYDFDPTPLWGVNERKKELMRLFPEEIYNEITAGTRKWQCREHNWEELGLPASPNLEWYYTYENLIEGMAKWQEFAAQGDDNTKRLEIAAFLANIAQETGTHDENDPFGGPGCAIQEGYGDYWHSCIYGGCNNAPDFVGDTCKANENKCPDGGAGYGGRGPHQLSWNYNYRAFGKAMGEGDKYLKDPDLLTREPKTGIAGSIWFWGHADLGSGNDPDKPFKPSAHEVAAGKWIPSIYDETCGRKTANFGVIINIINGGLECGPGAVNPKAAKNRVAFFQAIADAMGVIIPEGFLNDCSEQMNFRDCVSYPDPKSRCGSSWKEANETCGVCCTSKGDCPDGQDCYGDLATKTPGGEECTCKPSLAISQDPEG